MLGAAGASWWPGWEQVTRAGSGHGGLVLAALKLQEVGGKEVREAQDGGSPKGLRLLDPPSPGRWEKGKASVCPSRAEAPSLSLSLSHTNTHTHLRARVSVC